MDIKQKNPCKMQPDNAYQNLKRNSVDLLKDEWIFSALQCVSHNDVDKGLLLN